MKKFYIASKFENKGQVSELAARLTTEGLFMTYDWTKNLRADSENRLSQIGQNELKAVLESDIFIMLLPAGKSAHVELGAAIAAEKKIYLYSANGEMDNLEETSAFYFLPGITVCKGSLDELMLLILGQSASSLRESAE